jgi:hypothetical protein
MTLAVMLSAASRVRAQSGAFTLINMPGADGTSAYGINNNGDTVGAYYNNAGNTHSFTANWLLPIEFSSTFQSSTSDSYQLISKKGEMQGEVGFFE